MIFVDSSVWVDWLRRIQNQYTAALAALISNRKVVVGDLVVAEVLQGVPAKMDFERTREVLLDLKPASVAGAYVAVQAAANHRHLRGLGITPRGTIDTLIATRCIMEGWPLLASDRDFRPFADHLGLELVTP